MIIQKSFAFEANTSVLCLLRRQTTVLNKRAFGYHTITVHVRAIINRTQVLAQHFQYHVQGMGDTRMLVFLLLCALFCVAKAMGGEYIKVKGEER